MEDWLDRLLDELETDIRGHWPTESQGSARNILTFCRNKNWGPARNFSNRLLAEAPDPEVQTWRRRVSSLAESFELTAAALARIAGRSALVDLDEALRLIRQALTVFPGNQEAERHRYEIEAKHQRKRIGDLRARVDRDLTDTQIIIAGAPAEDLQLRLWAVWRMIDAIEKLSEAEDVEGFRERARRLASLRSLTSEPPVPTKAVADLQQIAAKLLESAPRDGGFAGPLRDVFEQARRALADEAASFMPVLERLDTALQRFRAALAQVETRVQELGAELEVWRRRFVNEKEALAALQPAVVQRAERRSAWLARQVERRILEEVDPDPTIDEDWLQPVREALRRMESLADQCARRDDLRDEASHLLPRIRSYRSPGEEDLSDLDREVQTLASRPKVDTKDDAERKKALEIARTLLEDTIREAAPQVDRIVPASLADAHQTLAGALQNARQSASSNATEAIGRARQSLAAALTAFHEKERAGRATDLELRSQVLEELDRLLAGFDALGQAVPPEIPGDRKELGALDVESDPAAFTRIAGRIQQDNIARRREVDRYVRESRERRGAVAKRLRTMIAEMEGVGNLGTVEARSLKDLAVSLADGDRPLPTPKVEAAEAIVHSLEIRYEDVRKELSAALEASRTGATVATAEPMLPSSLRERMRAAISTEASDTLIRLKAQADELEALVQESHEAIERVRELWKLREDLKRKAEPLLKTPWLENEVDSAGQAHAELRSVVDSARKASESKSRLQLALKAAERAEAPAELDVGLETLGRAVEEARSDASSSASSHERALGIARQKRIELRDLESKLRSLALKPASTQTLERAVDLLRTEEGASPREVRRFAAAILDAQQSFRRLQEEYEVEVRNLQGAVNREIEAWPAISGFRIPPLRATLRRDLASALEALRAAEARKEADPRELNVLLRAADDARKRIGRDLTRPILVSTAMMLAVLAAYYTLAEREVRIEIDGIATVDRIEDDHGTVLIGGDRGPFTSPLRLNPGHYKLTYRFQDGAVEKESTQDLDVSRWSPPFLQVKETIQGERYEDAMSRFLRDRLKLN